MKMMLDRGCVKMANFFFLWILNLVRESSFDGLLYYLTLDKKHLATEFKWVEIDGRG